MITHRLFDLHSPTFEMSTSIPRQNICHMALRVLTSHPDTL